MSRTLVLLSTVALVAACSSGTGTQTAAAPEPAPPPALDPVGVYDFTTSFQGQALGGSFTVTGTEGNYGGSMITDLTPEVPIVSVVVDGMTMTLVAETPDGDAIFVMNFDGANFSGNWEYGMDSGTLQGSKR